MRMAIALGIAVMLAGCAGPRVTTADVCVVPGPTAGQQRVQATLTNRGGDGEVKANVRLHSSATDRIYVATRTVAMKGHDRVELVVDVAAPPGAYRPEVEIEFPP